MPTYTDDPHVFWRDRPWPKDDIFGGNIFLARAMLELGSVMFPGTWTGLEPLMSLLPRTPRLPSPPLVFPKIPQPLQISAEKAKAVTQDEARPTDEPWWGPTILGSSDVPPPKPLVIEHDPAVSIAIEEAKARWVEVMQATTYFLHGGWLGAAWRDLFGGELTELAKTDWFTEDEINQRRFLLCRIDPRPQFKFIGPPAGPAFIYVSGKSLEALLAVLRLNHPDAPMLDEGTSTEAETGKAARSRAMVADAVAALYGDGEMPIAKTRDFEIATWVEKNRKQAMAVRSVKRHLKDLNLIG